MKNTVGILSILAAAWLAFSGSSGPSPDNSPDDVSAAFDVAEKLWRVAQGSLADRLESGEITSETAATEWFAEANKQARKQAFQGVLEAEHAAFGGENWTAKKHAEHIRRYVR